MTERLYLSFYYKFRERALEVRGWQESDQVGPDRSWLGLWILALDEWSGWHFPKMAMVISHVLFAM